MKSAQLAFLVTLIAFSFFCAIAQETSEKSADLSLKLRIKTTEEKLCAGKEFKILARMENVSGKNQIIDERNLWRYYQSSGPPEVTSSDKDFEFARFLKLGRFQLATGDNFPDDDVPSKYLITLKPNEFYEESFTIKKDDNFFRIPGKYTMKIGYGQFADWSSKGVSLFIGRIDSNELEFTLSECKAD